MVAVISPVHLILGDEPFLAERVRSELIAHIRAQIGGEVPVSIVRAGDIGVPELAELLSPSLFAEDRIVVAAKTDEAGKEPSQLLLDAASNPAPGIYLIIVHSGGGRTKAMVKKFRQVSKVHEVTPLKPSERPGFVTSEFRRHNVRVTADVVHAVLEGVGSDLRELASAISQLVADTGGNVTLEKVREYYAGVAEVSGFDIADLACTGQLAKAVASTRRALQLGMSPVMLAAALSSNVGAIARLYSTRQINANQLASVVGMPPWKVDKTAKIARRWSGDAVSKAVIIMGELDAAVKGQSVSAEYAIEKAVREIAELAAK
ncbi:DNA polymerase III subunit delta [Corynebacterium freiburgense]|uniref:DNA polymerase III subunit delta n=1 Tax=Corynebacterium freiburgense TaxID=556548 RepID=UPI000421ED61|nr:DNA polymerase III subunit delta [Corynebacterium freiburgense]WJZ03370.1 hypothetical protein CFREI_10480 [Corynebacterium freiburgense]